MGEKKNVVKGNKNTKTDHQIIFMTDVKTEHHVSVKPMTC